MADVERLIQKIPQGYSEASINGRKYGISRSDFNNGNSLKVYAEELGGNDFISFNFYKASTPLLKPCEMPQKKVIAFLKAYAMNS